MEQFEVRSLCRHLLAVLLVLVGVINHQNPDAQQIYNPSNYTCSDSGKTSCAAFALYRAQEGYTELRSIATLFNTNLSALADLNKLPTNKNLTIGHALIIPLNCICSSRASYANLTHIIASGDTFYNVNLISFESLSTVASVIDANPSLNYMDLTIGTPMIFPVRCACPSLAQISDGTTSLVTYPVQNGDSPSLIAAGFGVPVASVVNANSLLGANSQIVEQTTLLVPINYSTPTLSAILSPPAQAPTGLSPSAPGPTAGSYGHLISTTGVYVAIPNVAVWLFLALSL